MREAMKWPAVAGFLAFWPSAVAGLLGVPYAYGAMTISVLLWGVCGTIYAGRETPDADA